MTMFVVGDCSTWRFPSSVRVSGSTNHYAQIDLFHDLFSKYSCVSKSPRFNKKRKTYDYGLSCTLDPTSFSFLYPKPVTIPEEIQESESKLLHALGGYADAEGSIYPYCSGGHAYAAFVLHSKDYPVLTAFYKALRGFSYNPYLNISSKVTSKNYMRLGFSAGNALPVLNRLEFRHCDKAKAKQLVLKLHGERWGKAKPEYLAFRDKVKSKAKRCKEEARRDYILRHGQAHLEDTNQTIPDDLRDVTEPSTSKSISRSSSRFEGEKHESSVY